MGLSSLSTLKGEQEPSQVSQLNGSRLGELFTVGLRQRDLLLIDAKSQNERKVARSTYKLHIDADDYSYLLSFGINIHGDHAIFIRNDDAQRRPLSFVIDRYFLQMSPGSFFTIIFDSYEKKTFGITGHVGEVTVNNRVLPHGEIVVLDFSGFKALFQEKREKNTFASANESERTNISNKETVTIQPDPSIKVMNEDGNLPSNMAEVQNDSSQTSIALKNPVAETAIATPKVPLSLEKPLVESFDFEQIQNRVLTRLQTGLEAALKVCQGASVANDDLFSSVMGEKIWKPLIDENQYQSQGDFLFAKETLQNENQLLYHRLPQIRKSILQSLHDKLNPSQALIPMVPKKEFITSKKAASEFNAAHYKESLDLYKDILSRNPNSLYTLSNLGSAEYLCGEMDHSIEHLEKAIEYAPYDGYSYGTLAIVKTQNNRTDEAIDDAISSIALTPEIPESYLALGLILHERGWYDEALKAFEDGLTKNPNSGDIHRAMAKTLKSKGSGFEEKSKFHYKRSVQLGVKKDPTLE